MVENEQNQQNSAVNRAFHEVYAESIAKAWLDPAFKEKFLTTPADVLKEHGADLPEGKRVVVFEDNPNILHLTLPEKPELGNFEYVRSICDACE